MHITIASVYVHDDADKGIYGCGEFNLFHVDLNGTPVLSPQRNWLLALPPLFQAGTMDVKYCSDHQYLMPADLPPGINTYVISAVPGHVLALTGAATEYDNFSNHTTGAGAIPLAVPDPGLHAETTLEIEGSNSHGHMRLDLLIRVHTL
ncbi:hypothetical protein D1871_11870 [Nakamurella silvestris]|nr:hypothetical protein D1871_11870 [Nakamurella silvestris]